MSKDIRLDCTHYSITKTSNKQEIKHIASQNLSDIDFQDFIDLCQKRTAKPFFFIYW